MLFALNIIRRQTVSILPLDRLSLMKKNLFAMFRVLGELHMPPTALPSATKPTSPVSNNSLKRRTLRSTFLSRIKTIHFGFSLHAHYRILCDLFEMVTLFLYGNSQIVVPETDHRCLLRLECRQIIWVIRDERKGQYFLTETVRETLFYVCCMSGRRDLGTNWSLPGESSPAQSPRCSVRKHFPHDNLAKQTALSMAEWVTQCLVSLSKLEGRRGKGTISEIYQQPNSQLVGFPK